MAQDLFLHPDLRIRPATTGKGPRATPWPNRRLCISTRARSTRPYPQTNGARR